MHPDKYKETAIKFHVDDLAGALIPGSRLATILKDLEQAKRISDNAKDFLQRKGLLALLSYCKNEVTFHIFSIAAEIEQSERRQVAEVITLQERTRQKLEEENRFTRLKILQDQEEAKRHALEHDPRSLARVRQLRLREKYGLDYFIEQTDFAKLMDILRRVDNGVRLSKEEVVWLKTERDEFYSGYFTEDLQRGYHRNEAKFYRAEFEKTKDPWHAVNASSNYRKCKQSRTAELILSMIDAHGLKNSKLQSALLTTHGGVKRDLGKFEEAIALGKQAYELTPLDYRPCTLIGAVYMENGHYDLGKSWYQKAVERGYSEKSVDDELRTIFARAEKSSQRAMRAYLLNIDPDRYSWTF